MTRSEDVSDWWDAHNLLISDYVQAALTNQYAPFEAKEYVESMVRGTLYPQPPAQAFEALLLPILRHRGFLDSPYADTEHSTYPRPASLVVQVVLIALQNPDCPETVLSAAANSGNRVYRDYAAAHPNCPEEAQVQVALWPGIRGAVSLE